ncbi:WecB/TagA/CpsF family glycosyltransferase [Paenibacillus sp. SYP-B3998]|uniref:N-acetylglucosaminyldiphosphoundecaprenol N-acetyl-beta-D-mannosaminyltransferase n=1 Tax=Paenibacillus sp. SYP-B3998 TaxID=2678564 RepID=A0A6G4A3A8_9BACL|nr:WecB/TagA/CpsF family glycosyltransferase [Paenibacillus sp. SYP-B3998]NEW08872.1 WecB/TagA/CpsF family glycosyltransferase [Paenibacillus sp. SYP-B3998]
MSLTTTTNPAVASAAAIPKVRIYGVPISKMGMKQTVAYLAEAIEQRNPHQIITANPIMVMAAQEDPAYLEMMQQAELIVPDGTGVVWAANYVGEPVVERVPGYDLLHELMKVGEARKWKVYLLGASSEVIHAAADRLRADYPSIELVGIRDGYFGAEQDAEVIADIVQAAPDLLFVGRSAANQEPWIGKYKEQINIPVMMGVGGSFDVLSGKLKRAPVIFQKLRLEWFYRLLQEPWRYKRMLLLPKFALKVMRDKEKVTKS